MTRWTAICDVKVAILTSVTEFSNHVFIAATVTSVGVANFHIHTGYNTLRASCAILGDNSITIVTWFTPLTLPPIGVVGTVDASAVQSFADREHHGVRVTIALTGNTGSVVSIETGGISEVTRSTHVTPITSMSHTTVVADHITCQVARASGSILRSVVNTRTGTRFAEVVMWVSVVLWQAVFAVFSSGVPCAVEADASGSHTRFTVPIAVARLADTLSVSVVPLGTHLTRQTTVC